MLSASHNPMPDNGIKFFARGGHKLPDDVEDAIELRMREAWQRPDRRRRRPGPRARPRPHRRYVAHLLAAVPHRLDGLKVVVDCANGAASQVAPAALRAAGRRGRRHRRRPGRPEHQRRLRLDPPRGRCARRSSPTAPTPGIAHDGDADRCLAVDAAGNVIDGDQIMAILALALRDQRAAGPRHRWSRP